MDQRLVRDNFLRLAEPAAWALYLVLVTVADAQGLSYYSDATLSRLLKLDEPQLARHREQLLKAQLLAYQKPLYQVLALPPGEPNHGDLTGGRSVWWRWVAPSSGTLTISTAGSTLDTGLGLYTGSAVSSLTTIAGNDDADASHTTSQLAAAVVGGTEYAIAVDGYGGQSGAIALSLNLVPPSLSWTRSGNNIIFSWQTNWVGYVLESAKSLTAGSSWDQVSSAPAIIGHSYVVTNAPTRPALFYRLHLMSP